MKHISIKARVTLWYTVLMAVLVGAVLLVLSLVGESVVRENAHQLLMQRVNASAQNVEAAQGDTSGADAQSDGIYLLFYDSEYRYISGSWPANFPDAVVAMDEAFRILNRGETFYVYDRYIPIGDRGVWIRGILPAAGASQTYRAFMRLLWIVLPLLVLGAAIGGWRIARRAFAPVAQLCAQADSISGGSDLSVRIDPGPGDDELHRMARTFDRMFDRLERSFRTERQFTSDVAHELRTPTAVILAECEFALSGEQNAENRDSYETIQRQARRMSRMTEQMLELSRMDSGRTLLHRSETDIAALLENICREQVSIPADGSIERTLEPVTASVDPDLITRVAINLFNNAIKYGGKHIAVDLKRVGECFAFSVRDDGIGIAEEHLPHVFDRFYRADSARTDGSMGLGLSMVKRIVEMHGGEVGVDSCPGKGSRFTVTIPIGSDTEV